MLTLDIAYGSLVVLVIVLGVTFLYLLGYTFWTRAKKKYWANYRAKFRDYFFPMVYDYVYEEEEEAADKLVRKLTKRSQDLNFFLEMLEEIRELLKGEETRKLDRLLEHELFYNFYRQKLFSLFLQQKLKACLYFEKGGLIDEDERVSARLVSLSRSRRLKLAFAASKALQSSEEFRLRQSALIRFLKRDDISDLMVSELLHYFHNKSTVTHREVGKALKKLLLQPDIRAQRKKMIVLYFGGQNFYEFGDFLLRYLEKLSTSSTNIPLISALVHTLGELHMEEAAPLIRNYMREKDVNLQIRCVNALGKLGGEDNLLFLAKQLLNVDFSVRKAIIANLVGNGEVGKEFIKQFLVTHRDFISGFRDEINPPGELAPVVREIRNTAKGINIMLSRKFAADHV